MSHELNCNWRCENPKHKLIVRRHNHAFPAPICPICRKPMVQHKNLPNFRIEQLGLSKRRVKRNNISNKEICISQ